MHNICALLRNDNIAYFLPVFFIFIIEWYINYVTSIKNISKSLTSTLSNLTNFHPLEVVVRVSKTQLQVNENSNWIIWRLKCWTDIEWIGPIYLVFWAYGGANQYTCLCSLKGGGPRVVVSTAAFHARVRGSVPGLGGLKETKMFLTHPRVKVSIVGSLRDREVACSASDRQGSNFESCVWRTVSS